MPGRYRRILLRSSYALLGGCLAIVFGLTPALAKLLTAERVQVPIAALTSRATVTEPSNLASSDPTQGLQQGREAYQQGQFEVASRLWKQSAEMFQQQKDSLNQALALSYLALAQQQLGQLSQAEAALGSSLNLLQNPPLTAAQTTPILAQVLNTQGSLQLAQGKTDEALSTWQQAANTYKQIGDRSGQVGSLINQAQAQQALGLYLQARKSLTQAQETLQQESDPGLRAAGLLSLGNTLRAAGDLSTSARLLEEALTLVSDPNSALAGEILLSSGNTARAQQTPTVAIEFYRQVVTRSPLAITRTQAQLNQLSLLLEQKRWAEAKTLQSSLRDPVANLPLSRSSIYAQINFVQSLTRLRQTSSAPAWQEIAQLAATTVQKARSLKDPQAESYALGTLGGVYEKTGQWQEAQELTQTALVLAQSTNATDIAYQWQWQLGRLLKAQNQPAGAIAAYNEAVSSLKTLRNDLVAVNSDVQFSFREGVEPVYRQLVGLLLQPQEGQVSQANLRTAREVIESLQLAQLDNFFREACLNARPAQIDRVDAEAATIYSIVLDDRLEMILSLPGKPLQNYSTAIRQAEMERTVDRMWRSLRRTSSTSERVQIARRMYDLVIRPMEADLAASSVKTLVFVLDGTLQSLPMSTLYDGQQYLIEKYSIALAPGLQLLEPQPLAEEKLKLLVGGLSEASQGFAALPGVETEIQQITSKVPAQVLLNQAFTSQAFQDQISSTPYPIVHLATHGQFSSNAKDTFILAWDSPINVKQLDALLRSRDEGRPNPIELLVLSACQTAAGDRRAALGLAGVAVRSGARSTLATLWSVDDQSTSFLMVQFYQKLAQANMTKAEALRQAQLELQKQVGFKHPYYWAPFVLVGNWL